MFYRMFGRVRKVAQLVVLVVFLLGGQVAAQTSTSPNYKVDQTFFGTGSERDLESDNYSGSATVGDLGVGAYSSANYRAYAGFNTTDEPYLEFVVTGTNIDLGYLNPTQASTANATFYVRAWQTSGYVVRSESDPPTNASGGYQLTPMPSQGGSVPGTKQFGINLVANTSPTTFGAPPQQVPDVTFSFGTAASGYDTADQFKHVKGDVIAQAIQSTSVTIYTVSYLFNIDEATPSGRYDFNHVMVATATY
jgi:hypothetical protein